MVVQLDTENKTIALQGEVGLGELFETMEKLLPNGTWGEYKVIPYVQNLITERIIVDRFPTYPNPYWQPWITYGGDTEPLSLPDTNYDVIQGVFEVQLGE